MGQPYSLDGQVKFDTGAQRRQFVTAINELTGAQCESLKESLSFFPDSWVSNNEQHAFFSKEWDGCYSTELNVLECISEAIQHTSPGSEIIFWADMSKTVFRK